jgi:hypothetical protein
MTARERKEWQTYFKKEKQAGRTKRVGGGMEVAADHHGNEFKQNGNACCGCGLNKQAEDASQYGKPPKLGKRGER